MPKIQWENLPPALRDHLFDRLRERKITVEDPKTFPVARAAREGTETLREAFAARSSREW